MANVVLNRLTICGSDEDVEEVVNLFKDENGKVEFSLGKIIPVPGYHKFCDLWEYRIKNYLTDKTEENLKILETAINHWNANLSVDDVLELYYKNLEKTNGISLHDW